MSEGPTLSRSPRPIYSTQWGTGMPHQAAKMKRYVPILRVRMYIVCTLLPYQRSKMWHNWSRRCPANKSLLEINSFAHWRAKESSRVSFNVAVVTQSSWRKKARIWTKKFSEWIRLKYSCAGSAGVIIARRPTSSSSCATFLQLDAMAKNMLGERRSKVVSMMRNCTFLIHRHAHIYKGNSASKRKCIQGVNSSNVCCLISISFHGDP